MKIAQSMIVNFLAGKRSDIVFCIIDRTHLAVTDYAKELVKNQADYTISNIHSKGFDIVQGLDEDAVLTEVSERYSYAVVISTGTEFLFGDSFFKELENLIKKNFFIVGHILDRGNAYYELHHQCYIINLNEYRSLGCPFVGEQELGSVHYQRPPIRSSDNYHDNYTPTWIKSSQEEEQEYQHKCHGWNILSVGFSKSKSVLVFDENIRNYKFYLYPETSKDFNKNLQWVHKRFNYCSNSFIHKESTDIPFDTQGKKFKQLLVPASGFDYSYMADDQAKIIVYDYNKRALAYWKEKLPDAEYIYVDLLGEEVDLSMLDFSLLDSTLINVSNIFCYEGTSIFSDLKYRLYKENQLIENIKKIAPDSWVHITSPSWLGFKYFNNPFFKASDFQPTNISELTKPTWHCNKDWIS